jgi:hypothetical protein
LPVIDDPVQQKRNIQHLAFAHGREALHRHAAFAQVKHECRID